MTLEAWIHKKLIENISLSEQLALFNNSPAVFYQTSPKDMDAGWNSEIHYPRIDFELDLHEKTRRKISGQVKLNIWCYREELVSRAIEYEVDQLITDRFIELDDQEVGVLVKTSSILGREITDTNGKMLNQKKIVFDLITFPVQETSSPDPIIALNNYVKTLDSSIVLLEEASLEGSLITESESPILYLKLSHLERDRENNSVIWMNAKVKVYIFTKTEVMRMKYLKYLADELSAIDEVMMLDDSPMFINRVAVDYKADPLRSGQMEISVQYGVLRKAQYAHPLMNAKLSSGL